MLLIDTAGGIGELQESALNRADQAVVLCPPDYIAANNIANVLSDPDLDCPSTRRWCSTTRAPRAAATWRRSSATSPATASRPGSASPTTTRCGSRSTRPPTARRAPAQTRLALGRLAATIGEGLQ